MRQAVGLVEVRGLASAVTIADTMLKVANVALLGVEKAKGQGWMTIKITGDVAAVTASVDAGKSKSIETSSYVSALVIPRPAENLEKLFFNKEIKKEVEVAADIESKESTEPEKKEIEKIPDQKISKKKETKSKKSKS